MSRLAALEAQKKGLEEIYSKLKNSPHFSEKLKEIELEEANMKLSKKIEETINGSGVDFFQKQPFLKILREFNYLSKPKGFW